MNLLKAKIDIFYSLNLREVGCIGQNMMPNQISSHIYSPREKLISRKQDRSNFGALWCIIHWKQKGQPSECSFDVGSSQVFVRISCVYKPVSERFGMEFLTDSEYLRCSLCELRTWEGQRGPVEVWILQYWYCNLQ